MVPDGIGTWPRRRAVSAAGRPAVLFRGEALSYGRLADRVDALAGGLRSHGVEAGDRVAYLGDNHPSFVETLFATALLGAVLVPLNTRLAIPELAFMLADSGARVLISTSPLEPRAAAAAERSVLRIVVRDPEPGDPVSIAPDALDYDTVMEAPPLVDPPVVDLDAPALIIYTSGTTGRPKGAVLTHGNLTWNAVNVVVDYDLVSTDRALMISPLFHVASLGMGCLPTLLKGATLLLEERFEAGAALASVERLRATTLSGVPTTFQLMTEHPTWAATDISSLRLLTCGGSPVPDRVRAAYEARGLAFSGGYGMTEAAPGVTLLPPSLAAGHGGSAGLPHFFTSARIRRADGELARPLERGEIEVRGPNVFAGYWGLPRATEDAFTGDRWFRTGDVGWADEEGFVFLADRLKDMIISGGENIYSAEVEQAISAIDGVTAVAVIGVPHERWGEVPHAVITLAPGATLDPEMMVARLSASLARYKVPRTLEVVGELPRTASGKIRKQDLRDRYAAGLG